MWAIYLRLISPGLPLDFRNLPQEMCQAAPETKTTSLVVGRVSEQMNPLSDIPSY